MGKSLCLLIYPVSSSIQRQVNSSIHREIMSTPYPLWQASNLGVQNINQLNNWQVPANGIRQIKHFIFLGHSANPLRIDSLTTICSVRLLSESDTMSLLLKVVFLWQPRSELPRKTQSLCFTLFSCISSSQWSTHNTWKTPPDYKSPNEKAMQNYTSLSEQK